MAGNRQAGNHPPISASLDSEFELDLCDSELPSEKKLREKALHSPQRAANSGQEPRTPAEGSSMNPVVLDDSQATDNDSIYYDASDTNWKPDVLPDLPDYDDEVEVLGAAGSGKGARGRGDDAVAGPSSDGGAGKGSSPGKIKSQGKGSRSSPYSKGHTPPGGSSKGKQPAKRRPGSPPRSPGSPTTESLNLIDSLLQSKREQRVRTREEIYLEHRQMEGVIIPGYEDNYRDDDKLEDIASSQKHFWTSEADSSIAATNDPVIHPGVVGQNSLWAGLTLAEEGSSKHFWTSEADSSIAAFSDPVIHPGVGRTKYVVGGTNFGRGGPNVSVDGASSVSDGAATYGMGGPNVSVGGTGPLMGRSASGSDKGKPSVDELLQTAMKTVTSGRSKEFNPLVNRNVVWTGKLEWEDKNQPSTPARVLGCKVSTSQTQPVIDTSSWPSKLTMQLCPADVLNDERLIPLIQDARKVRLHFQTIATSADLDNMTNLNRSLGSESDFGRQAGLVHFPRSTRHNIRVLLLLFHSRIKSFVGLIPNDQQAMLNGLRDIMAQEKRIHQTSGGLDDSFDQNIAVSQSTQSTTQPGTQSRSQSEDWSSSQPQAPMPQDGSEDAAMLAAVQQSIAMSATANAASAESSIEVLCEACQVLYGHNSMVECCQGHIICRQCVETSAKAVLVGDTKGSVICSKDSCTSSIPQSELRKTLPSIVMDLLEERWKKETMEALEDMKDVVKCAVCGFSGVLDMSIKQFECSKCKKSYCRYCEMEWHLRQHDLCFKTKTMKLQDTGASIQIPAHWSEEGEKEVYTNVELSKHSREYGDIAVMFATTLCGHKMEINKIYRIQNLRLWDRYSLTRSHMVEDLGELHLREMRLFHGTQRDVADAICQEGFDWRLCGKNGTAYGKGTYFAKHAVTSLAYSGKDVRGGFVFGGGSGFSLGRPPNPGNSVFTFGPGPPPPPPSSGFGLAPVSTNASPSSGFNFGPAVPSSAPTSGFHFGQPSSSTTAPNSGFQFGQPVSSTTAPSSGFILGQPVPSSANNAAFGFGPGANSPHPSGHNFGGTSSTAAASANFWNNQQPQQGGFGGGPIPLPFPTLPSSSSTSGSQTSTANTPGFGFHPHPPSGPSQSSQSGFSNRPSSGSNLFVRPLRARNPSGVTAVSSSSSSSVVGNTRDHLMFVGRVLVGRTCQGRPDMRRPGKDPDDPEGRMCHSAVNNVHNPKIFVIFDMAQCYPEYLIQYS